MNNSRIIHLEGSIAGSVKPYYRGISLGYTLSLHQTGIGRHRIYKWAFDATELMRILSPDGSIGDAEIQIGDSQIMISDESPGMDFRGPATIGGTPLHVYMYVEDVDRIFAQAVAAGATAIMPFWKSNSGATAPAPW